LPITVGRKKNTSTDYADLINEFVNESDELNERNNLIKS